MAGIGRFLKNAWNKEPVVTAACGLGVAGQCPHEKFTI